MRPSNNAAGKAAWEERFSQCRSFGLSFKRIPRGVGGPTPLVPVDPHELALGTWLNNVRNRPWGTRTVADAWATPLVYPEVVAFGDSDFLDECKAILESTGNPPLTNSDDPRHALLGKWLLLVGATGRGWCNPQYREDVEKRLGTTNWIKTYKHKGNHVSLRRQESTSERFHQMKMWFSTNSKKPSITSIDPEERNVARFVAHLPHQCLNNPYYIAARNWLKDRIESIANSVEV